MCLMITILRNEGQVISMESLWIPHAVWVSTEGWGGRVVRVTLSGGGAGGAQETVLTHRGQAAEWSAARKYPRCTLPWHVNSGEVISSSSKLVFLSHTYLTLSPKGIGSPNHPSTFRCVLWTICPFKKERDNMSFQKEIIRLLLLWEQKRTNM